MSTDNKKYEFIINVLKNVKNDSERFASLMIVVQTLKSEGLNEVQRREVFKLIGPSFPSRLVNAALNETEDENKKVYFSIGISVISTYCSDKVLVENPSASNAVPGVTNFLSKLDLSDDLHLIKDSLQYMLLISSAESQVSALVDRDVVTSLLDLYIRSHNDNVNQWTIQIITNIFMHDKHFWLGCQKKVISALEKFVLCIVQDKTENKFQYMSQLTFFLQSCACDESDCFSSESTWVKEIGSTLFTLFSCKVGKQHNITALLLACELTNIFSFSWCQDSERNNKVFVLLMRLICIEISMMFYENTPDDRWVPDNDQLSILLPSFCTFEKACSVVAEFDQDKDNFISFDDIKQISSSLQDVITSLQTYLSKFEGRFTLLSNFALACLRVIGSWLNVEYFACSDLGLQISTTFLKTAEYCVDIDQEATIKSIVPAIINYSENQSICQMLYSSNFVRKLSAVLDEFSCSNQTNVLIAQSLISLFINSAKGPQLKEVFKILVSTALKQFSDELLQFYILCATIILWNKIAVDQGVVDNEKKFFQKVITVLHEFHATDGKTVFLSER